MTGLDPLAQQVADDAAVAASFAAACGIGDVEVQAARDGSGTLVVDVPLAVWMNAAVHARDALEMDFFDWLSAVDAPGDDPAGVQLVLHVAATSSAGPEGAAARYLRRDYGTPYVQRLLLRTRVPDAGLTAASLTGIWPGAAWHERETFEMFGVGFEGYDDGSGLAIRPLLLPDGFEGTPLRKSFVLASRAAKAWPGAKDPADTTLPAAGPTAAVPAAAAGSTSGASGAPGTSRAPGGTAGAGAEPAGRGAVPRPAAKKTAAARGGRPPARRKTLPPGVPDPSWGPRYGSGGSDGREEPGDGV